MARAVATEANSCTFLEVDNGLLQSKYFGETEQNIIQIFEIARAFKPAIIFIDEADAVFGDRSSKDSSEAMHRATGQFIKQMQNEPGIFVIAATNNPEKIDTAILSRLYKNIITIVIH